MPDVTTDPFTGWLFPRDPDAPQRWKAVVTGPTESRCWANLLDHAGRGDRLVLPTGKHPSEGRSRGH